MVKCDVLFSGIGSGAIQANLGLVGSLSPIILKSIVSKNS